MTKFGNLIRIEAYVPEETYKKINKVRQEKDISLSGFVASLLISVFGGDRPKGRVPNDI